MRIDLLDRLSRLLDTRGRPYAVHDGAVCIPSVEHPIAVFGDLDQHVHYSDRATLRQFIVLSAPGACAMVLSRIENGWHHSVTAGRWASITLDGLGYDVPFFELGF